MEILRVEHLSKIYGTGENRVVAVDDVSFSIEKGEFVAIVGASGSGKSTLLHLIGGVDRPTAGNIYIDGNDICSLDSDQLAIFRRRQIGIIYQFYNLIPILDVAENITLPCDLDGEKVEKERLNGLLNSLGLYERRHHLPNELSGGQQQRVLLARALCATQKILLLDEPVAGLDPKVTAEMYELISRLNGEGITIIMISHDIAAAVCYADHILHIGKRIFFGTKEDYRNSDFGRLFLLQEGGENDV